MDRQLDTKYNLSLGTAGVFNGPFADVQSWLPIMYVNVRTLYRNFVASFDTKHYKPVSDEEFIETFLTEVSEFERIVKMETNNRVSTVFYYPKYEHLNKRVPYLKRKPYNPSIFDQVEENMWHRLIDEERFLPFNVIILEDEGFESNYMDIMLLSSFVVDLLEASKFNSVTLLESYTGKLKKRQEWYTKLNLPKTKDYTYRVPFNRFTLQIFGDKSGFFEKPNIELRKAICQMAREDNWLPLATPDRIKASIKKLKGYEIKEKLYSYF